MSNGKKLNMKNKEKKEKKNLEPFQQIELMSQTVFSITNHDNHLTDLSKLIKTQQRMTHGHESMAEKNLMSAASTFDDALHKKLLPQAVQILTIPGESSRLKQCSIEDSYTCKNKPQKESLL